MYRTGLFYLGRKLITVHLSLVVGVDEDISPHSYPSDLPRKVDCYNSGSPLLCFNHGEVDSSFVSHRRKPDPSSSALSILLSTDLPVRNVLGSAGRRASPVHPRHSCHYLGCG